MSLNTFEDLVREYFELQGYFFQSNIRYLYYNNNNKTINAEIDLLGLNPITKDIIHVEVSEDNNPYAKNEDGSRPLLNKFYNQGINDQYKKYFNTTDVRKLFVVWTYESAGVSGYKKVLQLGQRHKIEIISHETVFKCFNQMFDNIKLSNKGLGKGFRELKDKTLYSLFLDYATKSSLKSD